MKTMIDTRRAEIVRELDAAAVQLIRDSEHVTLSERVAMIARAIQVYNFARKVQAP